MLFQNCWNLSLIYHGLDRGFSPNFKKGGNSLQFYSLVAARGIHSSPLHQSEGLILREP